MTVHLHTVPITTNASGAFSANLLPVWGALLQYRYVPAASDALATGADLDIVGATTGFVYVDEDDIGTSAFSRAPRQGADDFQGNALLFDAEGEPVPVPLYVSGESLTVTIANGGDTKSGTLYLWIGET